MKSVLKEPLFWLGLVVKVTLLPLLGSHEMRDLFLPFLDSAVTHMGSNPWTMEAPNMFPYGSALFLILAIPKYLLWLAFGTDALGASFLSILAFKIPLFVIDILFLNLILHLSKSRKKDVLIYYWLNPILIFISYIHVQLDMVPMFFCILSLQQLLCRHFKSSGLWMACAVACKFHVAAIVPLMIVFIWNNYFAKQAIKFIARWFLVFVPLVALSFYPLFLSNKFGYVTVTSPEAMRLFAAQIKLSDEISIYIGLSLVLAVLGRLAISTRIKEEGLLFGSASVFGALLLATNAGAGWYFWVVPFIALFFSNYRNVPRTLFWTFQLSYLFYFGIPYVLGRPFDSMKGSFFYTVLQTLLAGVMIHIWVLVVRKKAVLQGRSTPFIIGISGDSGSGKNSISAAMADLFGASAIGFVEGDDYHKWERNDPNWSQYTHLHPRANFLEEMTGHTRDLAEGRLIFKSHYDHTNGMFQSPREIRPSKTMILQGLHTFYLRGMRDLIDLKIFLLPDELVRLAWKLRRDVGERNHPVEKVLASIDSRKVDAEKHILPLQQLADWIIEVIPAEPITKEEVLQGKYPKLSMRYSIWNDVPLQDLVQALRAEGLKGVNLNAHPDSLERVVLNIPDPQLTVEAVGRVASACFPSLRHLTRSWKEPIWKCDIAGIHQLMTLSMLSHNLK